MSNITRDCKASGPHSGEETRVLVLPNSQIEVCEACFKRMRNHRLKIAEINEEEIEIPQWNDSKKAARFQCPRCHKPYINSDDAINCNESHGNKDTWRF